MQAFHGVTIDIEGTQNCKWRNFPQEFAKFLRFSFFEHPIFKNQFQMLKGNFLKKLKISQAVPNKNNDNLLFPIFFLDLFWNFFKKHLQLLEFSAKRHGLGLSSPPLKALDKEKELLKPFSFAKNWENGSRGGERDFSATFVESWWGFWNLLYLVGFFFLVIPGNFMTFLGWWKRDPWTQGSLIQPPRIGDGKVTHYMSHSHEENTPCPTVACFFFCWHTHFDLATFGEGWLVQNIRKILSTEQWLLQEPDFRQKPIQPFLPLTTSKTALAPGPLGCPVISPTHKWGIYWVYNPLILT